MKKDPRLVNETPSEPLSYTARACDVFAAGRLDAQYFMPAKEQMRQRLAVMTGANLREYVDSIRDMFILGQAPATMKVRNYDLTDALVPLLDAGKEPSFAAEINSTKKKLKKGDIVISRLRAYLKEIAVVHTCDDIPTVGSSEFIVLRPQKDQHGITPEMLMVFLRSSPVQIILKWCQGGSKHPRFSESDLLAIPVPDAVTGMSEAVTTIIRESFTALRQARLLLEEAQEALLAGLGLADWAPPEPLCHIARAKDVFTARRLDARFFAPRIQALLDILGSDGRTLGDLATPRHQKFRPEKCDRFHYIEIGNIDGLGAAESTQLACVDAPTRATWYVKPGDIITSTVRPIRRLSAKIGPKQDGHVCSSGFVVIKPHNIAPELLLTYLRLPAICELLDIYASASMYPAVNDAHIFDLPIPKIDTETEAQVVNNMYDAEAAKMQVAELLETAECAVEIAIQKGQATAMDFLDQAGKGS